MMVTTRGSVLRLVAWQWRAATVFTVAASAVVLVHRELGARWLVLPTLPLAVVGAALGIFASFRTNSAYDRWWEARRLWGGLVNASRLFATQVTTYLAAGEGAQPSALQRELVRRHIAYVHVLRCLLREQDPFVDEHVVAFLSAEERAALLHESNLTYALIHRQMQALTAEARSGALEELRLQSLDRTIGAILDVQGGCERIKKTPMPRGYGFIGDRLVMLYSVLFPIAIVSDLGWATIPVSVLVCLSFALIGEAGRVLEDPFTMFWNGLPLQALSVTIEINLRERLGDVDLPTIPRPDGHGILM